MFSKKMISVFSFCLLTSGFTTATIQVLFLATAPLLTNGFISRVVSATSIRAKIYNIC